MTNLQFMARINQSLALPSQYATGAFGAPTGYKNNTERYASNSNADVAAKIRACPDGVFMYDCRGLGMAQLYGFCGDPNARYGGAVYKKDGIPDFTIKSLHKHCNEWKDDGCPEDAMVIGEWMRTAANNHVGFYAGNGKVAECTQLYDCKCRLSDIKDRDWKGHGKLKYIDYVPEEKPEYIKAGAVVCPHCQKEIALYTEV